MNGHQSDPTITDEALLMRLGGGRFTNLVLLGAGGMGEVFRADDTRLHRTVAIKRVHAMHLKNEEMRRRLERECRLHARLGVHQHIVALYDTIEENGEMMLVMEFVEGMTLQGCMESVHAAERLALADALLVLAQVLEALVQIHSAGIVHRDLKPANILVRRDSKGHPTAKLLDFGIARRMESETSAALTTDGRSPGTPVFMAPEQIDPNQFGAVTQRTDIYAIGIIAYQLAAGKKPFTGSTMEILSGHLMRNPPAIEFAPATAETQKLWDVITHALAKDPAKRMPDAKTFRDEVLAIRAAMVGRPAEANEITILEPIGPLPETPHNMNATVLASAGPGVQGAPATLLANESGTRTPQRSVPVALVVAIAAAIVLLIGGAGFAIVVALKFMGGNAVGLAEQKPDAPPTSQVAVIQPTVASLPTEATPTPATATTAFAGQPAATSRAPVQSAQQVAADPDATSSAMDIINQRLNATTPRARVRMVDPTPATTPPPPTSGSAAGAAVDLEQVLANWQLVATQASSAVFRDGNGRNVTLKLRTPLDLGGQGPAVSVTLDAISARDAEASVTVRTTDGVKRQIFRQAP